MGTLTNVLTIFVAIEHIGFLILEMFLWRTDIGLKIFGMSQDTANVSSGLAANQGLYNGFLAAGLLLSLNVDDPRAAYLGRTFFLTCVLVAGIFGGLTVSKSIIVIQALPALLTLILFWFFR